MKVSLKTWDGQHYLCAELDGRVVADRTQVGGWEEWELTNLGGDTYTLTSAHGRFLCAEPDGRVVADRRDAGIWESWRIVQTGEGVAFVSHHGLYLCAEGGGGGAVLANRQAAGPWETWFPSQPIGGDSPGPIGDMPRLEVEGNKRWFSGGGRRFDWREISAFGRLGQVQAGREDLAREGLRLSRSLGFTIERVFVVNPIDPWKSGPDRPHFWSSLTRLLEMAAEEGIYLRLTFIAGTEAWGGVWDPVRRSDLWNGNVRAGGEQFAVELAVFLVGVQHVVGEIFNEPGQIGLKDSFEHIVSIGRKVKAVNPGLLLCGGAVDGPNDQDTRLCVEPFDYVDAHIERRSGVGGFEWVKRSGEYALIDQEHVGKRMPFVSGEPINFAEGRSGDVDTSPSVAFAYGAVSRARQYSTCFHYDGGLRCDPPGALALEHIRAYMDALNAFPMLTGRKWRGHHGIGAGDYWRDSSWPDTDDTRKVEDHIQSGRGPWRAFGCEAFSVCFPEPKGWDWTRALDAPAERLATCQEGTYAASVYKRT